MEAKRKRRKEIQTVLLNFCIGTAVFLAIIAPIQVAEAQRALDPNLLAIFSTGPDVEVNWPVIFSVDYRDPTVNHNNLVFVWTFEGSSQACTIRGRANVSPCRNRVMEKTWNQPGTYLVTLTVSYPGGVAVSTNTTINVLPYMPAGPIVARREIRSLGFNQWNQTVHALWTLKTLGVYDHIVYVHQVTGFTGLRAGTMRSAAHRGPAFLPWHRIILRQFERCVQVVMGNPYFGLPYWDWTIDQALPGGPMSSVLWTDNWFGPSGVAASNFAVRSGPFCSRASNTCAGRWPVLTQLAGPDLERELGRAGNALPSAWQVNNILSINNFDAPPYNEFSPAANSFRQALEGWNGGTFYGLAHNAVHQFIGGSMGPMTSPNDPVFFFHHCNTDRIWYQWQVRHRCYNNCWRPSARDNSITQATPGSVWVDGQWRLPGHHWNDVMFPWSLRPADVADNNNSLKGYYYN